MVERKKTHIKPAGGTGGTVWTDGTGLGQITQNWYRLHLFDGEIGTVDLLRTDLLRITVLSQTGLAQNELVQKGLA
jgi:hypothetical protein